MTGTLPTPEEVEAFLADPSPDKRARKIDELLGRPTYAAWWTTKLCDITGNSAAALPGPGADPSEMARHWYEWIDRRVARERPVRRAGRGHRPGHQPPAGPELRGLLQGAVGLLPRARTRPTSPTARRCPTTGPSGRTRKPEEKALNFSYAFLGVRLECAQCHKHPFDQWTQDDFNQFTAFFNGDRLRRRPRRPASATRR